MFTRADEIDEDGINEPPVARDDQVRTRVDQPVVVDVLDNDEDPDGDVLLVTSVSGQPAEALVTPTADRTQVQVDAAGRVPRRASRSTTRSPTVGAAPRRPHVTVDVVDPDGADQPTAGHRHRRRRGARRRGGIARTSSSTTTIPTATRSCSTR